MTPNRFELKKEFGVNGETCAALLRDGEGKRMVWFSSQHKEDVEHLVEEILRGPPELGNAWIERGKVFWGRTAEEAEEAAWMAFRNDIWALQGFPLRDAFLG